MDSSGSGRVKANTLIGLNYPWSATYFGGIEVNLEAIANDYRKIGTSEWNVLSTLESEVTLQDLGFCTNYDVRIRTVCDNTFSDFEYFSFTTSCSSATSDLSGAGIDGLLMYPNPFNDYLVMKLKVDKDISDMTINVLDAQGRNVISQYVLNPNERTIEIEDLARLSTGIYVLQFITDKGIADSSVIKQ